MLLEFGIYCAVLLQSVHAGAIVSLRETGDVLLSGLCLGAAVDTLEVMV